MLFQHQYFFFKFCVFYDNKSGISQMLMVIKITLGVTLFFFVINFQNYIIIFMIFNEHLSDTIISNYVYMYNTKYKG